jgi:pyruvate dehydrogenase E1 component
VRGNGKINQEREAVVHGAGWNVIKVVWGREWDHLLAADNDGLLTRRMGEAVDGDYQKYVVEGGAYVREHFFGTDPRLAAMVEHLSDDQLARLRRGGHDLQKVYAAYAAAVAESERPTVILAKTVKGWLLGESAEGKNVAHQVKKIEIDELRKFRDRLDLPVSDSQLENPPFLRFPENSREFEYLRSRREALGGFVPKRVHKPMPLPAKPITFFSRYLKGSGTQEASTTGIYARILADLLGDKEIGGRIVPIIPDEARTFGLDSLFNRFGIYSSKGQLYEPVDSKSLMKYREARDGVVLEEGICEAGSMASFTAVGTSYATHGVPMIPRYIFSSMFGLQRTGDQAWAFGDQRARGFLLGATAGRTTLNGEGLQHQDGHSQLLAAAYPALEAYDPAFGYEVAVIIQHGLERMLQKEHDVVYYVTLQNEAYAHPEMPAGVSSEDIIRGLYKFRAVGPAEAKGKHRVHLLGSGSIMQQVLSAATILAEKYSVAADVWSATSYQQLRRDAQSCDRWNMLHPAEKPRVPYVTRTLGETDGPVIAASDYMKMVSDQIAQWIPGGMYALGTDGYGRSDTRAALRRHFEVDAESIVIATLHRLSLAGKIKPAVVAQAIKDLGVDPEKIDPQHA